MKPALVIHGGAGQTPESERAGIRRGCAKAMQAGWLILESGGSAVDAVCASVMALEADPLFNAGIGSALTAAGTVEMDASVMDGCGRRAGAGALLRTVPHPVQLARAVLEDGQHVLLAGPGAEAFAVQCGIATCDPDELVTAAQQARWLREQGPGGTVGAAAVDRAGHVAAATSTGGRFGKRVGRIGDSAIVGAGTCADDTAGAASATGNGEAILRVSLTHRVVEALRAGMTPQLVAAEQLAVLAQATGATGGVIVVDILGRVGWAHSTPHMPMGWMNGATAAPVILA